jgi:hypothetical protein
VTEIQTARLLLRPWQPDDLAEFTRLLTDPEVTRYIVHTPFSPQDVAELSDRTLEQWERNGFGPWAAIEKQTGRWVGRIGLDELADWPGPHKIEVGWELHRAFWGRGLATEGGRARRALWLRDGGPGADHQRHHGHQCRLPAGDGEVRPALPGRAAHGRDRGGLGRHRPSGLAERRPAEPGRIGRLTRQAPGNLSRAGTIAATVTLQHDGAGSTAAGRRRRGLPSVTVRQSSRAPARTPPGYVAHAVLDETPLLRALPRASTQDNDELDWQGGRVYLHLGARRDDPPEA